MSLVSKYNPMFLERAKSGQPPFNDAEAKYGVKIQPVAEPDKPHWRVIGVHHLTGEECGGEHHVFLDVLDAQGQRIQGAQLTATKGDLPASVVTIDKPANEPGTNVPMYKQDRVTVAAVCAPDSAPLPSDQVVNLSTIHADEEAGTTLYHHSFYVVFQEAAGAPLPVASLEETLRSEGEPLVMPLNHDAALYHFAFAHQLGERLTREYVVDHGSQRYVAQIYENGLVYVPFGQWDKIQVIPRST